MLDVYDINFKDYVDVYNAYEDCLLKPMTHLRDKQYLPKS
jgi:hypothetical protein